MVAGLASALSLVPWDVVISRVPDIVTAATRLFQSSRLRDAPTPAIDFVSADQKKINPELLAAAVRDLESTLTILNAQMSDASRVIKDLADTNARLVISNRQHAHWLWALSIACFLSFGAATAAFAA